MDRTAYGTWWEDGPFHPLVELLTDLLGPAFDPLRDATGRMGRTFHRRVLAAARRKAGPAAAAALRASFFDLEVDALTCHAADPSVPYLTDLGLVARDWARILGRSDPSV